MAVFRLKEAEMARICPTSKRWDTPAKVRLTVGCRGNLPPPAIPPQTLEL